MKVFVCGLMQMIAVYKFFCFLSKILVIANFVDSALLREG